MSDEFDIIVIGSGAGGGTLAHTLAPSRKRILLLERGDFLTKELGNWNPGEVFVDGKYISPDTWYDGDGTPSSRNRTTLSAARAKCTAPRCTACVRRTSAS